LNIRAAGVGERALPLINSIRSQEDSMGLWDIVKGEFIDVIEWLDDSGDTLVWRFPDQDQAIKMGAQLTVREGQIGVFVNEGEIADVFPPGLYTLSTQNMPIMTTLRSWKYGFRSPFKAEVYFVSSRNFLDLKWGTQNPIMTRDPEIGPVRLRAFGTYGIRVNDVTLFMREIVGTDGHFTTDEIEGQLRSIMVSAFTGMLARSGIAALDLAANYRELGEKTMGDMAPEFERYGLKLIKFVIENISLPPEVEKMLDVRSQMGLVGDLSRFTQFQTAQAITDAARSGGGAGEGLGIGAGLAMGRQMVEAMSAPKDPGASARAGAPAPSLAGRWCSQCGKPLTPDAKFCGECGAAQSATACPSCGRPADPGAKFCPECGAKL
jgi:membrane protease subunit (stomatin/prohibitin family)